MKPHRCTRFKKTGSLKMMAASIQITVAGKRTEQSMHTDAVHVRCVQCGGECWMDRRLVEEKGKFLTLKRKRGVALGGQ